jgi:lipopolysaccharide export system permease protein
MRVLQRYFATEIIQAVVFVLIAFLALFAFFDMMSEVRWVGQGPYRLEHAFLYVSLGLPAYAYQLMPIAVLIGTIYVMSQFAARSEFTVMRASSLSMLGAIGLLLRLAILFALITFALGEFLVPKASDFAENFKRKLMGAAVSAEFRSGLWAKDVVRGADNKTAIGSRFINARKIKSDGVLKSVRIFEFDPDMRMLALITADEGRFLSDGKWELRQVEEIRFDDIYKQNPELVSRPKVVNRKMATSILSSEITPAIMAVLVTNPDKMSALDLASFSRYLAENKQRSERYEIAFWSKVLYPFAVFVMMAMALPFAYLHVRSGGLSLKIFAGIMIGVSFQLINSLFTHLGLLNAWPPFATAMMPSTLFLIAAIWALRWVERH